MDLDKQLDLINSEGTILGLYHSKKNELFLGSLLSNSNETIFFNVDDHDIRMYINGYITLNELYRFSKNFFVVTKLGRLKKTYLFEQYECDLQYGDLCYDQLDSNMKPEKGLEKFTFNTKD